MEFNKQNIQSKVRTAETHVIDEGLRTYMLKVYNFMASGIFLTGIIALLSFKLSVVTDASGKLTLQDTTVAGELTVGKDKIFIDGVAVTGSATELNKLDGLSATKAELDVLHGITVSTSEINSLKGIQSSANDLNMLKGTSSDSKCIAKQGCRY